VTEFRGLAGMCGIVYGICIIGAAADGLLNHPVFSTATGFIIIGLSILVLRDW